MNIEPRKPRIPFDFGQAVMQPFQSVDGRSFVWRLLIWMTAGLTLVYLLVMPFMMTPYAALLEYSWQNTQAILGGTVPPDPTQSLSVMAKLAPAYLFMMLGMWGLLASGESALHRKILHGSETVRRPLRFGKVELRIMLIQLGVWALWFAVYTAGLLIVVLAGALLAQLTPILGGVFIFIGIISFLCLLVWLPIRLAPAAALTLDQDTRHLLAANKVTKFRFWNLFLAYMVVAVLGYVVLYAIGAICVMVATGDPGFIIAMSGLGGENPIIAFEAAAERLKNPIFLIMAIASLAVYAAALNLWYLCIAGIGTYAVKWWRSESIGEVQDT